MKTVQHYFIGKKFDRGVYPAENLQTCTGCKLINKKKTNNTAAELLEACKAIQAAYGRTDGGQTLAMAKAVRIVNNAIKNTIGD